MATSATHSGQEPPSGIQGKGTLDEPYDQGNAPENTAMRSDQEPLSGVQGKGTATEPYDQGNAGESTTSSQPTNAPASSASTAQKTASTKPAEARTGALNAPTRRHAEERDVSPGTLPDGSHAQTSGDRGESYAPSKGLNRLKGKLGLGKH
ncbi:uncharacterized protein Z520_00475 [Fonsecaea multimorphosa CBS 102226]|uniref:Uncharacterized protein n=1 Tax=Fonsecaea multimorphosa CBS 102226 TaxID=1442371 RepID=A0A0D2L3Y6_9EURO|nr:uncharacterized protein Z520_00475 [Fonsecaea multimorphosa CBS 102226]KIY03784.1 hypothetical protein Z520_00475 [Fonsecaea multimorphosa CBS 102226]OAL32477.1 hypothetical protein AYO22_00499 [Fonsecaea multimorphosa]